jgi:hypothetical protein
MYNYFAVKPLECLTSYSDKRVRYNFEILTSGVRRKKYTEAKVTKIYEKMSIYRCHSYVLSVKQIGQRQAAWQHT